jgi:hypothetical protein
MKVDVFKISPIDVTFLKSVPTLFDLLKAGWSGLIPWKSLDNPIVSLWKADSLKSLESIFRDEFSKIYEYHFPGLLQVTNEREKQQSLLAIEKKLTAYQMEDVSYNINKYGFRGNFDLESEGKSIAFFGCSATFGEGVAEQDCFTTLIGKDLNASVYNFGVQGGSFSKATRYFHLLSQHRSFDYVVFLLPQIGRVERPVVKNNTATVENISPFNGSSDRYREQLYSVLDDSFLGYEDLKNLSFCVSLSKQTNTKIYFSSWSPGTYNLIYNFLGPDSNMLLPFFDSDINKENPKFGRDGLHPGPTTHFNFYKKSIGYILT